MCWQLDICCPPFDLEMKTELYSFGFHAQDFSRYRQTTCGGYFTRPTLIPSLGKSNAQVHSEKCRMCALSLTMQFGDVSASEWTEWLSLLGEYEEVHATNQDSQLKRKRN
jgi:hypothetical protein